MGQIAHILLQGIGRLDPTGLEFASAPVPKTNRVCLDLEQRGKTPVMNRTLWIRTIAATAGIVVLLLLIGYEQRPRATKYFLVTRNEQDALRFDICEVENPDAVKHLGRWIREHVDRSDKVEKARALTLLGCITSCWVSISVEIPSPRTS